MSITTWFTFIDFGLANGLKNMILVSVAKGDLVSVRKYISTAYFTLFKVLVCLSLLLIICNHFISWNNLIKGPASINNAVNFIFFYGLLLFFIRVLFELINPVLLAYHKTFVSSFIAFISQFLIVVVCYYYKSINSHSFVQYGFTFFWVPLLIFIVFNIFFYLTTFKSVRPSFNFFEKRFEKSLLQLGGNFFIIQIAVLIVFTTDNLIVGRILGYGEVSNYNIAFRYFSIPIFILTVILSPYWPLLAELYLKKDAISVKRVMKKLLLIWSLVVLLAVVMLFMSDYVYSLWLGPHIAVPFVLNLGMCLFSMISGWNSVFATFINATSKLRLQLISAIITGIINIPLSIYLAKHTTLGSAGVIFATSACLLVGSVWAPIQYNKLVNNKAKGIWNK